jgi:glutamate formiminotransferase
MTEVQALLECVPNFSEGRDADKIARIVAPFRDRAGLRLLDVQADPDHNRLVVTLVGTPAALRAAIPAAVGAAVAHIDLRCHSGQHPRMGAVDVVPFIPLRGCSMADAVALSREVARELAEAYELPVFLYEASASSPARRNLSDIRRGGFEGMADKLRLPEWQPDFGPAEVHPTAGVAAVGARNPLVAYNVNLASSDPAVAEAIARRVRHLGGGLRYCKAIGVALQERGLVQVSISLTHFSRTAVYQALEMVRSEARRYGVNVVGSEIVGLVPMAALIDAAAYYLGLEGFSPAQILETHLLEPLA